MATSPYLHELNITDGSEFLDDAIRTKDQPLDATSTFFINKKIKLMSTIKQFSPIVAESAAPIARPQAPGLQTAEKGVTNLVLVHGAFADGSSWAKVIPILQAKGYNVIAVQNPLTSFEDDVAATQRALDLMEGPVLLIAHSYGGMVITEAGNDPKVKGLVYVDALIPDDGQSAVDVIQPYPPSPGNTEFQQDAAGYLRLSYKGIDSHFAQDLPPEERGVLYATQIPWAAKGSLTKISKAAWKNKPSWCVIGLNDETIPATLTKAEAKMINATTLELESSHVPMLSQPNKVASFIISAAQSL
jgi:pimeloyl-ACP methyl ester carboxylesterase